LKPPCRCLIITDYWVGIDTFFEPGKEILVAQNGGDVQNILTSLTKEEAYTIGQAALNKVLSEHTYAQRAALLDQILKQEFRAFKRISMMNGSLDIVILGLSITSSWGNGHATTFRGLVRELHKRTQGDVLRTRCTLVCFKPRPSAPTVLHHDTCTAVWMN
jgi:spore maturation protein CgeB